MSALFIWIFGFHSTGNHSSLVACPQSRLQPLEQEYLKSSLDEVLASDWAQKQKESITKIKVGLSYQKKKNSPSSSMTLMFGVFLSSYLLLASVFINCGLQRFPHSWFIWRLHSVTFFFRSASVAQICVSVHIRFLFSSSVVLLWELI